MNKLVNESKIGYYPGADLRNNVISYLENHLIEFPERIALRWAQPGTAQNSVNPLSEALPHADINYQKFAERIASFAQGLLELGIKAGERVIIFLPMSLDMYTAMFAVQRIGAIAVFLDSWARSHHLGASAACVKPQAMISFAQAFSLIDTIPEFQAMPHRILYGPPPQKTSKEISKDPPKGHLAFHELLKPTPAPIAAVQSETTALITFTTGSTGTPKGANRTHRFLSAQHQALSKIIPYGPEDIDLPAFPIFSLNNLASGVTTILPALDLSAPSENDPALLASQIIHEKVNCATLSPSMLSGLSGFVEKQNLKLNGLRRVVTGGAPISKDDVKHFYQIAPHSDLWILYGSTEAEPMAHIEGREMLKMEAHQDPEIIEEGVNVGSVSEDIDFRFVKIIEGPIDLKKTPWSEIELKKGQVGEFLCTGDHVCRDYYNNPAAFLSAKIQGEDGRVWHRTGDLAYLDTHENLWIVGRTNNAIERNGEYFFPVRAEVLLKRLPFTSRCAFLGLDPKDLSGKENTNTGNMNRPIKMVQKSQEDETAWRGVKTAVVIQGEGPLFEKAFDFSRAIAEIKRIFSKNKIPVDYVFFVKDIPMDPRHHSKVEYGTLRKQLIQGESVIHREAL